MDNELTGSDAGLQGWWINSKNDFKNLIPNWRLASCRWPKIVDGNYSHRTAKLHRNSHYAVNWNADVNLWGNSKGRGTYANEHCHSMKV